MDWHYAVDGKSIGPVSEKQLSELAGSGTITGETLVWHAGMTGWQPYREITNLMTPPVVCDPCMVCHRMFPRDELLRFDDGAVCAGCKPVYMQMLREGVKPAVLSTAFRDGKLLVMPKTGALPDRCVKCNAPVMGEKLKRKLQWHHPAVYLVIILNIIIYAIVASVVSQKAVIHVGLCDHHRKMRTLAIAIGWGSVLLALVCFVLAAGLESGWPVVAGIALLLGGVIYAMVVGRVVVAKHIDKDYVRLAGVCGEFLQDLPEVRR